MASVHARVSYTTCYAQQRPVQRLDESSRAHGAAVPALTRRRALFSAAGAAVALLSGAAQLHTSYRLTDLLL